MEYHDGLRSARLTTRFLTRNDIPTWSEFFLDGDAVEFHPNPNNLSPMDRAEEWIERALYRYANGLYGVQALHANDTGELVGVSGLITQEVDGKQELEIGYHLMRQHWGKGYASEAAQLFRDYGFERYLAPSITSIIHPQNENSKRVARRNGMQLVKENASFRDTEYNLFRITKDEWLTLKDNAR